MGAGTDTGEPKYYHHLWDRQLTGLRARYRSWEGHWVQGALVTTKVSKAHLLLVSLASETKVLSGEVAAIQPHFGEGTWKESVKCQWTELVVKHFTLKRYLFILKAELCRERKREQEKSFISWFTLFPKMASMTGAGLDWNQEPRDSSRSSTWVSRGPSTWFILYCFITHIRELD